MIVISLNCKCGEKIEITVPMFVDKKGNFICKNCFKNIKKIDGFIATAKDYIAKLEAIIERNKLKRKINDQLDLLIDDLVEVLRELRTTKKPLTKKRRDYFFEKLEKRQEKIQNTKKKVDKTAF